MGAFNKECCVNNEDYVLYSTDNTIPTAAPTSGVTTTVLLDGTRYEWNGTTWVNATTNFLVKPSDNTIQTIVNGVSSISQPIITTNANSLTKTGGLVNNINSIPATTLIPTGTITDIVGFNSTGNPVNQTAASVLASATTNVLTKPTSNTIQSTVNGVVSASQPIIASNVLGLSSGKFLNSTINGIISNSIDLSATDWQLQGNAATNQTTNFLGTTDNVGLSLRTNNVIRQTIAPTGEVGIGTTGPTAKLTVAVDGNGTAIGNVGTHIFTSNVTVGPNNKARITLGELSNVPLAEFSYVRDGSDAVSLLNLSPTGRIRLGSNNTEAVTILANKFVGLNKTNPTEQLDVVGNVRLSGALMPNNLPGTIGQILTSQGAGVAPIWQTSNAITSIKTIEGQSLIGTGNIDLTATDVGLGNVNNTSDLAKPISTATQTALNLKQDALVSGTTLKTVNGNSLLGSGNVAVEPIINAGTTAQYWRGDKTWQTLDKTAVGLPNVDNTSDVNKPISTATQTALNAKQNTITLTTTGTSGAATLVGSTLNIPNYVAPASLTSLNGLTLTVQTLNTGVSGTDFNIVSSGSNHTFNIPDSSTTARGLVNTGTQAFNGNKTFNNNVQVTGTTKLGVNGTPLTTAIKTTVTVSVPTFTRNSPTQVVSVALPNSVVGSNVTVNPTANLLNGLIIAYAYISAANTLTIGFSTGNTVTAGTFSLNVLVIE